MLDEASTARIADYALERLSVPAQDRPELSARIRNVSILASFRPPPVGAKVTPKQIVSALERIETGLRNISAGLEVIDDARRTVGTNAKRRENSLAIVERAILGAIAEAVLGRIDNLSVTDEQLAASMPEHGYLAFANSWNGVFGDAANRVARLREVFSEDDFRAPTREIAEWFARAVGQLAEIYSDATGKEAKAYSRSGDAPNQDWRPPFAQFVVDLWQLFAFPDPSTKSGFEKIPGDGRIADALALANASNLPPLGHAE